VGASRISDQIVVCDLLMVLLMLQRPRGEVPSKGLETLIYTLE
jgi:hypothetical protein